MRVGDNLVVQTSSPDLAARVGAAFLDAATVAGRAVVTIASDGAVVDGPGRRVAWGAADDVDVLDAVAAEDAALGPGAAFLFDSLTGVMAQWGEDAALELFLSACPRLFRRESLAMWIVDPTAHRPAFLQRLQEITQVVLDLAPVEGGATVAEVLVARGRAAGVVGRRVPIGVDAAGAVTATGAMSTGRERLGRLIREQRAASGLSQAEVARRVGVTPSALSQVERGVRGLSGETLVRVWEVLGVPFGPEDTRAAGYRVVRRGGPASAVERPGLHARRVVADGETGEVWLVEVDPGASGRTAVFDVKAPETVVVLAGVLDVTVGGATESLQEGDALVATRVGPTAWANPSRTTTRLVWTIHG